MKAVFSTFWKTLLIWPVCCGLIATIATVARSIHDGKFNQVMADPDWLIAPLFAYFMFWLPALVTGIAFCLIGVLRKILPSWSVLVAGITAFLVFYIYEYFNRPYFKSGMTESTPLAATGLAIFAASSLLVWIVVRNAWSETART
jgi:hypothetical protein